MIQGFGCAHDFYLSSFRSASLPAPRQLIQPFRGTRTKRKLKIISLQSYSMTPPQSNTRQPTRCGALHIKLMRHGFTRLASANESLIEKSALQIWRTHLREMPEEGDFQPSPQHQEIAHDPNS